MEETATPRPETRECPGGCCREVPVQHVALGEVEIAAPVLCPDCDLKLRAEEDEERNRRMLDASGAGERLRRYSLDTYPLDAQSVAALEAAERWSKTLFGPAKERTNLLIFGPVGTGKTGLAWGLLREFIEAGPAGMFVTFRDLLWQLRRSFSTGEPCDIADRAARVRLLVLDDLGAERPTDFARDELAVLVEHRYMDELPTIVTSNYTPDRLAARLGHDDPTTGQRIVSRLAERAIQIRLEGRDRRLAS